MKILITDDNPTNLKLLAATLEAEGHDVFQGTDGVEALAILEKEKIDAIISDILMPRMDGYRLCLEVRKSEKYRSLPFIFYTATYISPSDSKAALDLGADKFLKKPAPAAELIQALNEAIRMPEHRRPVTDAPEELGLMKEYSARLVAKLEKKAHELQAQTEILRHSEEQLRLQATALKAAANSILITDRTGSIIWTNPAFSALTGYAPEEVIGRNPSMLKSGRHNSAYYQNVWQTILSGQTWHGEFTNRRKDGTLYYGEQTITPVKSDIGEITHFVGIMNDATQRKEAEKELRETHDKLRHLLEHSPAVLYTLKIEGENLTPVVVSENMQPLLGYPAAETTSFEWWLNALHPEDRERAFAVVSKGMKGQGYSTEYQIQHKNGGYRWIQDNNRVICDGDGVPREAVGVWTDITERKQAEVALRESEEQYRDLFDNAHDLIQNVSPQGGLLYVNRAWRETLGYAEPDLAKLRLQDIIPPERRDDWQGLLAQVLAGKVVKLAETEFVSKDGRRISLEGSVSAKLDKGRAVSLRCIFRDVTEKKKLEAQFLRNQRMESLGTLAGGIAHDLNNVLTPILMALQILRMNFPDEENAAILDMLETSTKRGAEMVKQVLTFSRGFEGKRIEVHLQHLIKELTNIISQTFPKSIRVKAEVASDLWPLRGDATQLHQVLLNLCVNARDAMPHGGTISIGAENVSLDESFSRMNPEAKTGPYVVLTVADTGTGMTPEVREKIFDPFFTTKPLGVGTGLGLSTTRGIVKTHCGFISVYTEMGKGSAFKIYLPATPSGSAVTGQKAPLSIPAGRGELILVVDDETSVRSIVQQTLEMYGYRVLTAVDGAQAVAVCAKNIGKINLMLTDLMMPIMDGHAAIHAVKSLDPKIKIVAATGLPSEAATSDTEHSQSYATLHKPYTAERLLKTVRETLDAP